MSSKDDVARAPEWPVYHHDRVVDRDDHGEIARSGAIKNNKIWVDAKPVEEEDALEKLKKDKEAMMRRIIYDGEGATTKAFTLESGREVVLPSKKGKKGGKRRKRTRGKLRARSRRKKGGVHLKQVHNIIQPLKNEIMNLKSKITDLNNSIDGINESLGRGGRRKKRTRKRRKSRRKKRRKKRRRKKRTKRRR